jgi:hypothetical protein
MASLVIAAAAAVALAACEPSTPAEAPEASPIFPWTCVPDPLTPVQVDNRPPATVGQPTETAAQARRLYEAERWTDAIVMLEPVARGVTGDDEGNRQLAEYMLAKALFRVHRWPECVARFQAIAHTPNHLKHGETLLWIVKLARQPQTRTLVDPSDLETYTPADAARFDNAQQRDVYWQIAYLLGVQRYRSGRMGEAAALFGAVAPGSPYHADAQRCFLLARTR